jgi:hypothetical protein
MRHVFIPHEMTAVDAQAASPYAALTDIFSSLVTRAFAFSYFALASL